MSEAQIKQLVKERYPLTIEERNCATERKARQAARESYANKLRQGMTPDEIADRQAKLLNR